MQDDQLGSQETMSESDVLTAAVEMVRTRWILCH